jgi:hypothetical protein
MRGAFPDPPVKQWRQPCRAPRSRRDIFFNAVQKHLRSPFGEFISLSASSMISRMSFIRKIPLARPLIEGFFTSISAFRSLS